MPVPLPTESAQPATHVRESQALDRIAERLDLWCDTLGRPYASLSTGMNVAVSSQSFRDFLVARGVQERSSVSDQAVNRAIAIASGLARERTTVHPTYIRVAKTGDEIYIDLGKRDRTAVKITPGCWELTENRDLKFIRPSTMAELPNPVPGGNLDSLWDLFGNLNSDQKMLLSGWVVASLRGSGSCPLLIISGPQGSGKTQLCKLLQKLVDPSQVDGRAPIQNDRDLAAAAMNTHLLSFDNVSWITPKLSDSLCRVATGGTLGGRALYKDMDECLIRVQKPVLLNGIPSLATRADLAERSVQIELVRIRADLRRTEQHLWDRFTSMWPSLFGSLCSGLARALKEEPDLHVPDLPRMADPAKWMTAAEPEWGYERGATIAAWKRASRDATIEQLSTEPVAESLRQFLTPETPIYEGTMSDLLDRLKSRDGNIGGDLPANGKGLSDALRRMSPSLAEIGITISYRKTAAARFVRIVRHVATAAETQDATDAPIQRPASNQNEALAA